MIGLGTGLWVEKNIVRNHFIVFSFLSWWEIDRQLCLVLVPRHSDSVRHELAVMAWASSWTIGWQLPHSRALKGCIHTLRGLLNMSIYDLPQLQALELWEIWKGDWQHAYCSFCSGQYRISLLPWQHKEIARKNKIPVSKILKVKHVCSKGKLKQI